jgi:hypothetical protein
VVILGKLIVAKFVKKSHSFVEHYCVHESPHDALYNVISLGPNIAHILNYTFLF